MGGETLTGKITVEWFAMDDDYPSGEGIPIYLYYKPSSGGPNDWMQINDILTNNVDETHGSYQWDTNSLSDGSYMLQVEALDDQGNIAFDTSDSFIVQNGIMGAMVSDIRITDTTTDNTLWVKNGDTVKITAGITGAEHLDETDITADLSGFGGEIITAESFNGFTATWNINNVECNPNEGVITVTVTAEGISSNTATITADNTDPEMKLVKPENGLYFFNKRLIPLSRTVIIGPLTIKLDASDNSGIEKVEFYIDSDLMETVTGSLEWYMNIPLKGRHTLSVKVYDYAGNEVSQSLDILKLF
jgi:hypothetical protein